VFSLGDLDTVRMRFFVEEQILKVVSSDGPGCC